MRLKYESTRDRLQWGDGRGDQETQVASGNDGDTVSSVLSTFQSEQTGVVGIREGISYGLGLMVYILVLFLTAAIVNGLGVAFLFGANGVNNGIVSAVLGLFGAVVTLAALVIFFAGFAGLQYKIISDGVSRGN